MKMNFGSSVKSVSVEDGLTVIEADFMSGLSARIAFAATSDTANIVANRDGVQLEGLEIDMKSGTIKGVESVTYYNNEGRAETGKYKTARLIAPRVTFFGS